MSNAYIVGNDAKSTQMTSIKCKNESKELQSLLEQNYDLLPGDQIKPTDPCRWLLIRREMPIQDPNSGDNRWSIDFFFADQNAIPTFVECKRFEDTRSRREVIGQMLEYAANAHHYWTQEILREYSEATARKQGTDIEDAIRSLEPDTGDSTDDFFNSIISNLQECQIRLIFFMEEAPFELKSIVDFLNRQMERSEVLIVEARQYEHNKLRVVIPSLFGYTEEARRIKKTITVSSDGRKKWDEQSFFEDAKNKLDSYELESVRKLYNYFVSRGCTIRWGTGKQNGSYSIIVPALFQKSILSIFTNGPLQLNFGWLLGNDTIDSFRDNFATKVREKLKFELPNELNKKYPTFGIAEWSHKCDDLITIVDTLLREYLKDSS
jgi:hypothetical protein